MLIKIIWHTKWSQLHAYLYWCHNWIIDHYFNLFNFVLCSGIMCFSNSPYSWFKRCYQQFFYFSTSNPTSRILNKFSNDLGKIDEFLFNESFRFIQCLFLYLAVISLWEIKSNIYNFFYIVEWFTYLSSFPCYITGSIWVWITTWCK